VVSGVTARVPERLAGILYLDAYLPRAGHSLLDVWSPEEREAGRADIASGSGLRLPAFPAAMGIVDPDLAAWVAARLTPHPLRTYDEPFRMGIPPAKLCREPISTARRGQPPPALPPSLIKRVSMAGQCASSPQAIMRC
jgi:hypothetical protein